jgi:hypothetical protein
MSPTGIPIKVSMLARDTVGLCGAGFSLARTRLASREKPERILSVNRVTAEITSANFVGVSLRQKYNGAHWRTLKNRLI